MIGLSMLGIIGFLNILRESKKEEKVIKKGNYIEFDTEILSNFSEDYFSYFLNKYNVANRTKERIDRYYKIIEPLVNGIIEEPTTKEEKEKNKKTQESIKNLLKYIKDTIKAQKDKVKKFNEESYKKIDEEYNKIQEPKTKEDLETLNDVLNNIIQDIAKDENN